MYDITVESVNGRKTAASGSVSYPACTLQVGDRVARVWLADADRGDTVVSPAVLRGDAVALKEEGILLERSWSQAIVHRVTDQELAVGAASVYIPGTPHPTDIELRFAPVLSPTRPTAGAGGPRALRERSGGRQYDLSKRGPGLERRVRGGDVGEGQHPMNDGP